MFPCYVFELKQTVNNWLAGSTLKKALTLAVEVLHHWDAPNTTVFRVSLRFAFAQYMRVFFSPLTTQWQGLTSSSAGPLR